MINSLVRYSDLYQKLYFCHLVWFIFRFFYLQVCHNSPQSHACDCCTNWSHMTTAGQGTRPKMEENYNRRPACNSSYLHIYAVIKAAKPIKIVKSSSFGVDIHFLFFFYSMMVSENVPFKLRKSHHLLTAVLLSNNRHSKRYDFDTTFMTTVAC